MGDWSGTGYMVLDPDTYTGQYMVDGGLTGSLNGGVTSEAVDRAMLINFYMTAEDIVSTITLCCQLLRYVPAGGVVGALMVVAIVALGAYLIYTSMAYYQEAEDLAEQYYAGDMAAGEELLNRTAWDVTISTFAWALGIGSYVNNALARRAGESLAKTVGREAADKLMKGAEVPANLTKHVEKFLELGMTTEAITNLAESLKPVNFEKLGRLARQGMPRKFIESLAKNERVLEEFDEVMLLLFKDSKLEPDTIIRHLAEEGEDFISRFVKHGDEVFESGTGAIKKNLSNMIKDIRGQMPTTDLAKRGNMAAADVDIPGIKDSFVAHSKINGALDKGADVADFCYLKPQNERIFTTYVEDQYPRYHDTEAKILEEIASQITDSNVSGTINLYSELPCCQSCTNIIFEFRRMFPNIELNVFTE